MNKQLVEWLDYCEIPYETNVDLKRRTWIHRGGMCELYISPRSRNDLIRVATFMYLNNVDFTVLGSTSNVYILDTCNLPIVLSTRKVNFFQIKENIISVDAGTNVILLSKQMVNKGINGFEYLTDLPGTIGAAIYNNSSCNGGSIASLLLSVEVVMSDGRLVLLSPEELDFKYRTSAFKEKKLTGVIVGVNLRATYAHDPHELQKIAYRNKEERLQLLGDYSKSLGSTVNKCFSNGPKPLRFFIPLRIYDWALKLLRVDFYTRKRRCKEFICFLSGYKDVAKYISNDDIIIFKWLDTEADTAFPRYLEFMSKVYRTDSVEIEIIENNGKG